MQLTNQDAAVVEALDWGTGTVESTTVVPSFKSGTDKFDEGTAPKKLRFDAAALAIGNAVAGETVGWIGVSEDILVREAFKSAACKTWV